MRLAVPTLLVALALPTAERAGELERALAFELEPVDGLPGGWQGGPPETLGLDETIVHGGRLAGRIRRSADSLGSFSSLTRTVTADRSGRRIRLGGWLRTEEVSGQCGLWMRVDGPAGVLRFDNMADRAVTGSTEWSFHVIDLPLDEAAEGISFGVLLAGTGTAWADDLALLVDGQPIAEAPEKPEVRSIFETDREFAGGSGVTIRSLAPVQVENLALLGKVWGFLKYHHPKATRGELHWDFELFRVVPAVLQAKDAAGGRAALLAWLRRLGPAPACAPCAKPPEDAHLQPRLDWLGDTKRLGGELSRALLQVHANRPAELPQFWVSLQPGVGNPDFSREPAYRGLDLDTGYRLLAAFRLWNVIEYWFPYPDLIEEDWDDVLRDMVPRMVAASDREAYRRELLRFIARVHDTHANIWSAVDSRPPLGDCELPVELRFLDGEAIVTRWTLADREAARLLEPGDRLVALDGRSVSELVKEWSPYYAASNEPTRLRDIARSATRGTCGRCAVEVDRAGRRLRPVLERVRKEDRLEMRRWHDREGDTFQWLGREVAYLKLSSIQEADVSDHVRRALSARGLIIDIRNYPSAFTVFRLGQHLVQEATPFVRFTGGVLSTPGAFQWTEPVSLLPGPFHYGGPVVVLVDEVSQSSAEYTAMAFRAAPNTVILGSTTAGADGNVSAIPLPGGERAMISGIGVFYPDRSPTQRIGILPDLRVRPTRQGLREGRDEVLEEALRRILGSSVEEVEIRRLAAAP